MAVLMARLQPVMGCALAPSPCPPTQLLPARSKPPARETAGFEGAWGERNRTRVGMMPLVRMGLLIVAIGEASLAYCHNYHCPDSFTVLFLKNRKMYDEEQFRNTLQLLQTPRRVTVLALEAMPLSNERDLLTTASTLSTSNQ